MRRLLFSLLLVASGCASVQFQNAGPRLEPLTILHWNDFHAHNELYEVTVRDSVRRRDTTYLVGGSATLLGYIDQWRTPDRNVLTLNAGDDFQGTPISSLTFGISQIELMNIIGPDAMELGNHEFDYGARRLREALALAKFPVLCANVWDTTGRSTIARSSLILKKKNLTIGLLGGVVPELPTFVVRDSIAGLEMLPIDSVIVAGIRDLKRQKVNLIVLVSHMGIETDSALAVRQPELDVIVGGHDHLAFFQPKKINRTIIVQAGQWGRWLGKLDLQIDVSGDSVYSASGQLIETRVSDIRPNARAAAKVEELLSTQRHVFNEVIGELKTAWDRTPHGQRTDSNIGNWQADAIREYAGTDIAFQNSTGIRTDLRAGSITVGQIWMMNPFGNHFVTFSVTGKTLWSMLEFQTTVILREFVQVGRVRYVFDSSKPKGSRLVSVEVNGKPLDETKTYTVATNNYVASNMQAHFGIPSQQFVFTSLPVLDRDVFIEKIKKEKTVASTKDGRIKDLHATDRK